MIGADGAGSTAVVVADRRCASPTLAAATYVAHELAGPPDLVVDLATLGCALGTSDDGSVSDLADEVGRADLVVVALTAGATGEQMLRAFLQRVARGAGLRGTGVAVVLSADPPGETGPVVGRLLEEVGARTPLPDLLVRERSYAEQGSYADWLASARLRLTARGAAA